MNMMVEDDDVIEYLVTAILDHDQLCSRDEVIDDNCVEVVKLLDQLVSLSMLCNQYIQSTLNKGLRSSKQEAIIDTFSLYFVLIIFVS